MNISAAMKDYQKPWKSCDEQVDLLRNRGLIINDPVSATRFLYHLNYYRFSGYSLAFEQSRHVFFPNTTFEHIVAAYEFDRALRDIVTEGLEAVEVDFRTATAYHFGKAYGAFGHISVANFIENKIFKHAEWIQKIHEETERSNELFIKHFRMTYKQFPDLPVWVTTEVTSFGALSRMYSGMHRKDQKTIACRYGIQPGNLESWMHHFVYVRNLCAHHSRLWDRIWAVKPSLPAATAWKPPYLPGNDKLFSMLLALNFIMRRCSAIAEFAVNWRNRVESLLAQPPGAPGAMSKMGFTEQWKRHPLWR